MKYNLNEKFSLAEQFILNERFVLTEAEEDPLTPTDGVTIDQLKDIINASNHVITILNSDNGTTTLETAKEKATKIAKDAAQLVNEMKTNPTEIDKLRGKFYTTTQTLAGLDQKAFWKPLPTTLTAELDGLNKETDQNKIYQRAEKISRALTKATTRGLVQGGKNEEEEKTKNAEIEATAATALTSIKNITEKATSLQNQLESREPKDGVAPKVAVPTSVKDSIETSIQTYSDTLSGITDSDWKTQLNNTVLETITKFETTFSKLAITGGKAKDGAEAAKTGDWAERFAKETSTAGQHKLMQEYCTKVFGDNASKALALESSLLKECKAYGYTENSNPFIHYLLTMLPQCGISADKYAVIHNAILDRDLVDADLRGTNSPFKTNNIIFCKSLFQTTASAIKECLFIQNEIARSFLNKITISDSCPKGLIHAGIEAGKDSSTLDESAKIKVLQYIIFQDGKPEKAPRLTDAANSLFSSVFGTKVGKKKTIDDTELATIASKFTTDEERKAAICRLEFLAYPADKAAKAQHEILTAYGGALKDIVWSTDENLTKCDKALEGYDITVTTTIKALITRLADDAGLTRARS